LALVASSYAFVKNSRASLKVQPRSFMMAETSVVFLVFYFASFASSISASSLRTYSKDIGLTP
jgi:hypothetical protein